MQSTKKTSWGSRTGPGRRQHGALDALASGITRTKVNWIVDADIAGILRCSQSRVADALCQAPHR